MSKGNVKDLADIELTKNSTFALTEHIKELSNRVLTYLNAGYPVHLKGAAGAGKTSLAMNIAQTIGKPTTVIFGNESIETSDMVGSQYGYRKKLIQDNFIHSVHKTVEDVEQKWVDGRIIDACENGYTLIYDEFTRSRPETNNVLLSVFEEKVLELPINYTGDNKLIKVHPEFKAIFTSNPEEYAGVYKSQDALIDRFITLQLDFPDKESEINIVTANSGISKKAAESLVSIVRAFREVCQSKFVISLRDSIKLCRIVKLSDIKIDASYYFKQICFDVLTSGIGSQKSGSNRSEIRTIIDNIVDTIFKTEYVRRGK